MIYGYEQLAKKWEAESLAKLKRANAASDLKDSDNDLIRAEVLAQCASDLRAIEDSTNVGP